MNYEDYDDEFEDEEEEQDGIEFVNLTPHDINLFDEEGLEIVLTIPRSGEVARIETEPGDSFELYQNSCESCVLQEVLVSKKIVGLPKPDGNTYFIVSFPVALVLHGARDDVVVPDTSPAGVVRTPEGRIIGTKRFVQYVFE